MANFSGPTYLTNVLDTYTVPPSLNWVEKAVVLSSDGRNSVLALPGNTMTKINQIQSVVKPPVGKQEVYNIGLKLTRSVEVATPSAANPNPRITLDMIAKIPKGVSDSDVTDAIYDLYVLLAQGKVHKTLFVDGIALRP